MPIDVITSYGRRGSWLGGFGGGYFGSGFAGAGRRGKDAVRRPDLRGRRVAAAGLMSPGLAPAIEEIIVTAKPPVAPSPAFRSIGGTAGFYWVAFGFLASKILEEIGEQKLEEQYREIMAPDAFVPGDTPLHVMQPEVLPEIVVRAKTPFPDYVYPPMPQLIPWEADPFRMVPITPRTMPQPQRVNPGIEIDTPTLPEVAPAPRTIPAPRRTRIPKIDTNIWRSPTLRPRTKTRTRTRTDTETLTQTQTQTQARNLTRARTSVRTSLKTRLQAKAQAMAQAMAQRSKTDKCKPCPKEKKRTECYKKLVKESFDPQLDESYNWVEIDCWTGREL